MDAMEAILSRRSIRKYVKKPVPEALVNELLDAAMSAPSGHHQRPWHFVVVTDHGVLDEVPRYHNWSKMLPEAALGILVCGDVANSDEFWVQDCSAATQNLLLAAHARGLGAVWLGIYPKPDLTPKTAKLFGLPENIVPLSLVSIGYPGEEKPRESHYDPARIHYNHW
jgi:nitroreductase